MLPFPTRRPYLSIGLSYSKRNLFTLNWEALAGTYSSCTGSYIRGLHIHLWICGEVITANMAQLWASAFTVGVLTSTRKPRIV